MFDIGEGLSFIINDKLFFSEKGTRPPTSHDSAEGTGPSRCVTTVECIGEWTAVVGSDLRFDGLGTELLANVDRHLLGCTETDFRHQRVLSRSFSGLQNVHHVAPFQSPNTKCQPRFLKRSLPGEDACESNQKSYKRAALVTGIGTQFRRPACRDREKKRCVEKCNSKMN